MTEIKTQCLACFDEILQTTAERTGGLCVPCLKGAVPIRPGSTTPLKVTYTVEFGIGAEARFKFSAPDLLRYLSLVKPVGDDTHPNRLEIEAQKALLRHAIVHRLKFQLHDDHWSRTSYVLEKFFEVGKAVLYLNEDSYRFSDVVKEKWEVGASMMMNGGFLYKNQQGKKLYERLTWVS